MKSQPDNILGEPTEAVAPTGNQEALARLVGLSGTLFLRLIAGQLRLPEAVAELEAVA